MLVLVCFKDEFETCLEDLAGLLIQKMREDLVSLDCYHKLLVRTSHTVMDP